MIKVACQSCLLFTGFGKPLSKPLALQERAFEFSPFQLKKFFLFPLLVGEG
jgi:hypothetical protein